MRLDVHGLRSTAASDDAQKALDAAIIGYLKYRADTPARLDRAIALDPGSALAHCLHGYLAMTSFKLANVASVATQAARRARACWGRANPRERGHVRALDRWIAGYPDESVAIWEEMLAQHPTDILAFRLAHFVNFWLGRPLEMRASAERVLPHYGAHLRGYGTVLSCLAFAAEECGDYAAAEPAARAAIEIDPADYWGTHALLHVMEMQGRCAEGIACAEESTKHWRGGTNILHHLVWHRALFHLELREFDAALELYDRQFRNLRHVLTMATPDLYIDVQNAASMLFRFERHGVDVGERWAELADKAERRIGDCLSAFTLPHWMMALAATGRDGPANDMLEAMRAFGQRDGTWANIVGTVALPVSQAALAHRRGEHDRVVDLMFAVLPRLHALGGSHAQQDVLLQMAADSAARAGRRAEFDAFLTHAARGRVPSAQRLGYTALIAH